MSRISVPTNLIFFGRKFFVKIQAILSIKKVIAVFVFFLSFWIVGKTSPKKKDRLILQNVRFYQNKAEGLSGLSDITISNGVITDIRPSANTNQKIYFVVPSFCDTSVTLGTDPSGGALFKDYLEVTLKSFLAHGFTDIRSVGDADWILRVSKTINQGKLTGPRIFRANKPFLAKSYLEGNTTADVFTIVSSESEALEKLREWKVTDRKEIPVYHRYTSGNGYKFDSVSLLKLQRAAKEKNLRIEAHTYGDGISVIESLNAGIRVLVHPIPIGVENRFSPLYGRELVWAPMLAPYWLQSNQATEAMSKLGSWYAERSPFFQEHYRESWDSETSTSWLENEEIQEARFEFAGYLKFLQKHQEFKDSLLLASGSGNRMDFAGLGGWLELRILHSLIQDMASLIEIASFNSCSYVRNKPAERIQKGSEANLLLLKKNPLEDLDGLLSIQSVIQKGKLVYSSENKKGEKNERKTK